LAAHARTRLPRSAVAVPSRTQHQPLRTHATLARWYMLWSGRSFS